MYSNEGKTMWIQIVLPLANLRYPSFLGNDSNNSALPPLLCLKYPAALLVPDEEMTKQQWMGHLCIIKPRQLQCTLDAVACNATN
jgi:hypothetical protein